MATVVEQKWLLAGNSVSDSQSSLTSSVNCRIVFDVAVDDEIDAIAYAPFHKGDTHRNKDFMFIDSISADAESGKEWLFTLNYSTKPSPESENNESYESEIYPYSWGYTELVEYDKETGDANLNPAGDVLDPPLMVERASFGFRITVRETAFSETRYNQRGSLNNSTVRIAGINCPKYTVMLEGYDPKPKYDEDGYLYFLTEYDVKILKKLNNAGSVIGFKIETLNAGFNFLDGGVKKKILIPDEDGNMVEPNEPQLLTAAGAKATTASYTERCPRDLIDFSQLNLPSEYPKHTRYL